MIKITSLISLICLLKLPLALLRLYRSPNSSESFNAALIAAYVGMTNWLYNANSAFKSANDRRLIARLVKRNINAQSRRFNDEKFEMIKI